MSRPWEVDEVEYIKNNFNKKTYKEIGDHIGRTINSVRNKCYEEKWSKANKNVFVDNNDGTTTIVITHVNNPEYRVLIDTEDVEKVKNIERIRIRSRFGYVIFGFGDKTGKLHRLITDCPEGLQVDHINENKLDNTKKNLRICTAAAENRQNIIKGRGVCGARGVRKCTCSENYEAFVICDKIHYTLKICSTIEEAEQIAQFGRAYLMPFSDDFRKIKQEDIPDWIKDKIDKKKPAKRG